MGRKSGKPPSFLQAAEHGAIHKDWRGAIHIALIYPNRYAVGMGNLGFQHVYRLFNDMDLVVCERAFLPSPSPDGRKAPVTTVESGRPLADFDILAFSISFESDYPHLLELLAAAGLPLASEDRGSRPPLVIAGGVACWLNPEPISTFIDCFLIGEAEAILPRFMTAFDPGMEKASLLKRLAREVPGAYVPALYRAYYHSDGTLKGFDPIGDAPETITRAYLQELPEDPVCSAILTPETSFGESFLVEVSRGCPHGCRFCSAGFIYRPPRFRPFEQLAHCMRMGAMRSRKIGLVGAAVSDLPDLGKLCAMAHGLGCGVSFSSLRADALSPDLIEALKRSGVKTATIAPDAGSERMRRVINKGIDREQVLDAARRLVAGGIPNLKLYFMLGLPGETDADAAAVVDLCHQVKHHFLESSRKRGRMGRLTVSLSSFVPKPFTPFQWAPMAAMGILKKRIQLIKTALGRVANVRVHADVPRWAHVQALLSRGDRRISRLLLAVHEGEGNWPHAIKASSVDADFYVHRERGDDERFPWEFIDHGINRDFLYGEYQRAMAGQLSPDCPMSPGSCTRCGVCGPVS
jgi:radical SAM superfamily enzyme YgiQ (UPF0313 family)